MQNTVKWVDPADENKGVVLTIRGGAPFTITEGDEIYMTLNHENGNKYGKRVYIGNGNYMFLPEEIHAKVTFIVSTSWSTPDRLFYDELTVPVTAVTAVAAPVEPISQDFVSSFCEFGDIISIQRSESKDYPQFKEARQKRNMLQRIRINEPTNTPCQTFYKYNKSIPLSSFIELYPFNELVDCSGGFDLPQLYELSMLYDRLEEEDKEFYIDSFRFLEKNIQTRQKMALHPATLAVPVQEEAVEAVGESKADIIKKSFEDDYKIFNENPTLSKLKRLTSQYKGTGEEKEKNEKIDTLVSMETQIDANVKIRQVFREIEKLLDDTITIGEKVVDLYKSTTELEDFKKISLIDFRKELIVHKKIFLLLERNKEQLEIIKKLYKDEISFAIKCFSFFSIKKTPKEIDDFYSGIIQEREKLSERYKESLSVVGDLYQKIIRTVRNIPTLLFGGKRKNNNKNNSKKTYNKNNSKKTYNNNKSKKTYTNKKCRIHKKPRRISKRH